MQEVVVGLAAAVEEYAAGAECTSWFSWTQDAAADAAAAGTVPESGVLLVSAQPESEPV